MADSGFNIIKPVEGLQNVQGLAPTRQREGRKHQHQPPKERKEPPETPPESETEDLKVPGDEDAHVIDYRA